MGRVKKYELNTTVVTPEDGTGGRKAETYLLRVILELQGESET